MFSVKYLLSENLFNLSEIQINGVLLYRLVLVFIHPPLLSLFILKIFKIYKYLVNQKFLAYLIKREKVPIYIYVYIYILVSYRPSVCSLLVGSSSLFIVPKGMCYSISVSSLNAVLTKSTY